jgi:hypothetical protein
MNLDRYVVGVIGIACFVALQLGAWILGHDGVIETIVKAGISGILLVLFGIELKFKKEGE